ncbi:hypothetical protein CUMW_147550 [Citrus unshiu]|nr:hypothetical protein CUMW_147550 [Citrus unshiu]
MASIATRVYESSEYEGRLFREISAPDRASKPFFNKERMSLGQGKHPHLQLSLPAKTTSLDVISNSPKVEGSNVKQPKCFEAPYSFYRDYDLHSSSTQSDCKNIHPDVMRLDVKKRIKAD